MHQTAAAQEKAEQLNFFISSVQGLSPTKYRGLSLSHTHTNTLLSPLSVCHFASWSPERDMTNFCRQSDSINTGPYTYADTILDRTPLSSDNAQPPPNQSDLNITDTSPQTHSPCPPSPPPTLFTTLFPPLPPQSHHRYFSESSGNKFNLCAKPSGVKSH